MNIIKACNDLKTIIKHLGISSLQTKLVFYFISLDVDCFSSVLYLLPNKVNFRWTSGLFQVVVSTHGALLFGLIPHGGPIELFSIQPVLHSWC